jgi:hypothetical protein
MGGQTEPPKISGSLKLNGKSWQNITNLIQILCILKHPHRFFPCLGYEFGAPGDAFSAPAELMPSDLCYAIFTSGSTGASWELDHPKIFHGIILCLQAIGCNLEAGF